MKIRAYLDEGFLTAHRTRHNEVDKTYVFHESIRDPKIHPYINLPESVVTKGLRPEIMAAMRSYSIYDEFIIMGAGYRAVGMYRHADAIAWVTCGGEGAEKIKAEGKTLTNVVELCELIRAGSIVPIVPYDSKQVGNTMTGVKEAALRLIDAVGLACGQWRRRLTK
ncbi:hypothetical protein EXS56_02855 [Candidatus Kaiserbacteria bacterium]|nr:hypothetical protein [Candidatus Kaiserbacteria bacterium]